MSDRVAVQYKNVFRASGRSCDEQSPRSVNQLERKLNLTRGTSRSADDSKSAALHRIRGQTKINDVEYVEELRTKFQIAPFRTSPVSKRRVLDHGNVEIVIRRSPKGVAPHRAKST